MANYTEEELQRAIQVTQSRRKWHRQHYLDNKEKIDEHQRQYYQEHNEERAEHHRQHYQEHKEERDEQQRHYEQEHPEVHKAASARRRALIVNSNGHFTAEEFRLLCEVYEHKCAYCHQELPLSPDHAVPVSRGGSNGIDNIVPACFSCNKRKFTKTYDEFIIQLGKETK